MSAMAYGLSSNVRPPSSGASKPTTVAAADMSMMPREIGSGTSEDSSFFQRTLRVTLNPQTCARPGR